MKLKKNQIYLQSRKLYADICRLAQLRAQFHAIAVERARLEESIIQRMAPATEIIDLSFIRQQKDATEQQLKEMFVAKVDAIGRLTVHPPYVSERYRPENKLTDSTFAVFPQRPQLNRK